jgi:hypothetical protein
MKIFMFRVPEKLLSLLFVLTLAWFNLVTPALAGTNHEQSSEGFINKCLLSQPDKGIEQIACDAGKAIATGGLIVGVCYTADAMATGIFPPAIALAPLCNVLGVAGAGQQVARELVH